LCENKGGNRVSCVTVRHMTIHNDTQWHTQVRVQVSRAEWKRAFEWVRSGVGPKAPG